jgi:hypothetical protein
MLWYTWMMSLILFNMTSSVGQTLQAFQCESSPRKSRRILVPLIDYCEGLSERRHGNEVDYAIVRPFCTLATYREECCRDATTLAPFLQVENQTREPAALFNHRSVGAQQPTTRFKSPFDGDYEMVHDGWRGRLRLRLPGGEYLDSNGRRFRVVTRPISDYRILFYIVSLGGENSDGTGGQKFDGYLMTQTKDAIAGITYWDGRPFGFYAVKK